MSKLKNNFSGKQWSNLQESLWRVFVSVRLTITLLVLLIGMSIIGSLVAQQGQTQTPIEKLYTASTLKWLVSFGLTDIFHSSYFVFTVLLLALNLIACSIERLPKIWRETFHVTPPPVGDPTLKEWSSEHARKRKYLIARVGQVGFESVREAKMATLLFFQRFFGRYTILRDQEDQFQVMVEQSKFTRLGVYITHISLLLIMTGAVVGALFGFEGAMSIEEGTRQSWMQHFKGTNAGMVLMKENGVPIPNLLNLGFEVECEKFTLETYDGQRPKAFRSKLNFYENDVRVASTEIAVNHPFVFKGITFYQASFSEVGMGNVSLKIFRTPSKDIKAPDTTVELVQDIRPGELYRIDGGPGFRVANLEPNLMDLGPAAQIQFYSSRVEKNPKKFWIFQKLPGFDFAHRQDAAYHFSLEEIRPKYATGLSIARDPGVWIVWIGSAILVLALFLALYTNHRRYWITFTKDTGFVVVGWSNKLFLFDGQFEKFLGEFTKDLKL